MRMPASCIRCAHGPAQPQCQPAPVAEHLRIESPGHLDDPSLGLIHSADRIARLPHQVRDLLKTARHRRMLVTKITKLAESRLPVRYRCLHRTKPIAGEYCPYILNSALDFQSRPCVAARSISLTRVCLPGGDSSANLERCDRQQAAKG